MAKKKYRQRSRCPVKVRPRVWTRWSARFFRVSRDYLARIAGRMLDGTHAAFL